MLKIWQPCGRTGFFMVLYSQNVLKLSSSHHGSKSHVLAVCAFPELEKILFPHRNFRSWWDFGEIVSIDGELNQHSADVILCKKS